MKINCSAKFILKDAQNLKNRCHMKQTKKNPFDTLRLAFSTLKCCMYLKQNILKVYIVSLKDMIHLM